jgi:hypothetical protein
MDAATGVALASWVEDITQDYVARKLLCDEFHGFVIKGGMRLRPGTQKDKPVVSPFAVNVDGITSASGHENGAHSSHM